MVCSDYGVTVSTFALGSDVVPTKPWLHKLLTCSYQLMDTFNVRDLAMFAWGLAKLGVKPPAGFLDAYVQRVEFMAGEFPPQEVANTVWALACFNVRPSSVLLVQFFDATDKRLSSFKVGCRSTCSAVVRVTLTSMQDLDAGPGWKTSMLRLL